MKVRICKLCGKEFTTAHQGPSKYCKSDACQKIRHDREMEKQKERQKLYGPQSKETGRFIIFLRDGFKCIYCGFSSIEDGRELVVDHIIPIEKGGKSTVDNLVTSCWICNSQKQDLIMSEDVINRILALIVERNAVMELREDHKIRCVVNYFRFSKTNG